MVAGFPCPRKRNSEDFCNVSNLYGLKDQIHEEEQAEPVGCRMQPMPLAGEELYPRIRSCFAIIATSETALYANVILRKGALPPPSQS